MVLPALSATLLVASAGTAASPQSVTISVSRPSVVFGNSVTLSGKVSDHKVGEKVEVLAEPSGASSFSTLTNVDTTAGGQWTDVVKPTVETSYQAKWKSATSSTVTVNVRPLITLMLVNLSTGTFSTKVTAARSFAGKFVLVQRLSSTGVTPLKKLLHRQSLLVPAITRSSLRGDFSKWTKNCVEKGRAVMPLPT